MIDLDVWNKGWTFLPRMPLCLSVLLHVCLQRGSPHFTSVLVLLMVVFCKCWNMSQLTSAAVSVIISAWIYSVEVGVKRKVDISHGMILWNGLHMWTLGPLLPSHAGKSLFGISFHCFLIRLHAESISHGCHGLNKQYCLSASEVSFGLVIILGGWRDSAQSVIVLHMVL